MNQSPRVSVSTVANTQLMADWQELWEQSDMANYTNSPIWLTAALSAYQYPAHHIAAIYTGDRLDAVIAVVSQKRYGVRCLTRPGKYTCGTPFLLRAGNARRAFIAQLINILSPYGILIMEDVAQQDVVALNSPNAYSYTIEGGYNLRFLNNRRNVQWLLDNTPKILHRVKQKMSEFRLTSHSPVDDSVIQQVYNLEEQSSKYLSGYSNFINIDDRVFYTKLSSLLGLHMQVNLLYHNGANEPIAYEIGFPIKNTYWGNQTAYAQKYKKYAPGKILLTTLLTQFTNRKIKLVDFGSGDNDVKRLFTQTGQQLYTVYISSNSLLLHYLVGMRTIQNVLYHKLHGMHLYKQYRQLQAHIIRHNRS